MTNIQNRFLGRTAIITGGASGLGLGIARRVIAEGGRVALWDQNCEELGQAKTIDGVEITCTLDVSNYAQVAAAAE